jgi:hypothetical protein
MAVTVANARPQVSLSHDNRVVSVMPGKISNLIPNLFPKKNKSALYSTIATKYPNSLYFCCYGNTISGPSSFFGEAYGAAEQVIPTSSGSATSLTAAVGYVSGSKSVTLTLYADNGNTPGAELASGTGTSNTEFGACCGVVTAKIKKTKLAKGTAYWVGITAGGADFDAAPYETVDEVNPGYAAGTSNGGTSWGAGYQTTTRPAVSVQ